MTTAGRGREDEVLGLFKKAGEPRSLPETGQLRLVARFLVKGQAKNNNSSSSSNCLVNGKTVTSLFQLQVKVKSSNTEGSALMQVSELISDFW